MNDPSVHARRRAGLVTAELVDEAYAYAKPTIEAAIARPAVSSLAVLHLVVMDRVSLPGVDAFEPSILYERHDARRVDPRAVRAARAGSAQRARAESLIACACDCRCARRSLP